jgi:dethiobiotin synthetase
MTTDDNRSFFRRLFTRRLDEAAGDPPATETPSANAEAAPADAAPSTGSDAEQAARVSSNDEQAASVSSDAEQAAATGSNVGPAASVSSDVDRPEPAGSATLIPAPRSSTDDAAAVREPAAALAVGSDANASPVVAGQASEVTPSPEPPRGTSPATPTPSSEPSLSYSSSPSAASASSRFAAPSPDESDMSKRTDTGVSSGEEQADVSSPPVAARPPTPHAAGSTPLRQPIQAAEATLASAYATDPATHDGATDPAPGQNEAAQLADDERAKSDATPPADQQRAKDDGALPADEERVADAATGPADGARAGDASGFSPRKPDMSVVPAEGGEGTEEPAHGSREHVPSFLDSDFDEPDDESADEASPEPSSGDEIPAAESAAAPEKPAEPARAVGKPRPAEAGEWRGIVLVTGTDTDVGKTIVTAAIAAAAQAAGLRVAVVKPGQTGIITGAPTDIEVITRLAAPETVRTLAEYPEPMAPLAAATIAEMEPLELYEVVDAIRAEAEKHDLVLVEGAGGLLVPMGVRPSGEAWTLADLATTLGVGALVVARAGLGTLNHTALTLEALSRRGVPVGVIIGAWPADPQLVHWANLSEMVPHLVGALPEGAGRMDPGVFRRSAPGWLTPALFGVLDNWRVWAEETG